ncbi:MAG: NAD(P)-binding domain-containing protein, partial [Flavobacteriales bacterium]|nr:NAD(P)-binding domain-containing protein [Flavobacteriales bacterium]
MSNIIVLGAGMVGSTMAIDLAKKHSVTITDFNKAALDKAVEKCKKLIPISLDVTNKEALQKTIQPFDLVICAVPGFLGFETLKSILEAEKNVIDISFFPENAFELHELAKQKNVTAIVDCGVAPG